MKNFLFAILLPLPGISQFIMGASSGFHYQNFNSLSNSTVATDFVDNVTIPGWYSQRTTASIAYAAGTGSSLSGGLYSFGASGSTDRALGTIGSNNSSYGGNFAHGAQFVNNTGADVTQMAVSYKMEQWRCGGNTNPNTITFWYKILSTQMTNLMPGVFTGWTQVTALSAASPVNSATAGALDGNAAANKVVFNNISIPGLVIPNGSYIMLKWDDIDHTGSDHGLSIDDVTITWGCSSSAILSATSCGDYVSPAGSTFTNSGTYAESTTNSAFCDSIITIDLTVTPSSTFYSDSDNDGFGDDGTAVELCTDPGSGYTTIGGDCDDTDPAINPNATDICDGNDNDCDGLFEEDAVFTTYFIDNDNDGFGTGNSIDLCSTPGPGFSTNDQDCDDNDFTIYPNAEELCDGLDNDCDLQIDEDLFFATYYIDEDLDGFGTGPEILFCETPNSGFSINSDDCDDTDNNIYPNAPEILNNGIDENCDGTDNYLGLSDAVIPELHVAPNPSNGVFTIRTAHTGLHLIHVADLTGKRLKSLISEISEFTLDLSDHEAGIYLVTITIEGVVSTSRIVIE